MSGLRPDPARDPRAVVQLLVAVLAVVLVSALIVQLRRSAPTAELDLIVGAATDPAREPVTCQRRLPDATRVTGQLPPPVGRVTSTEVVDCPDHFDGQVVEFVGEVIGPVLQRDGGAWVLLNDDVYALEVGPLPAHQNYGGGNTGLSVWLPDALVDLVGDTGGPNTRGTVLQVSGVIHRVDPDDGGGLTLRAFDGQVLAPATTIPEPVHGAQVAVAAVLAAAALAVVALERVMASTR